MSNKPVLAVFFVASVAVAAGSAWAASDAASKNDMQPSTVQKDFGKLSADGARAFQDLTLTRIAIYDGKIDEAKKLVGEADSAFAKSQGDDSVYQKAEQALMTSDQMKARAKANSSPKPEGNAAEASESGAVAWLPVDGAISVDEDYTANPAKTKAVADANKSIAKGDRKSAIDTLKLADINTNVVLEVVPLNQTIKDVHQAAEMIDSGKYYEGSQMLRKVQLAARYDVVDVVATPKGKQPSAAPAAKADQPATSPSH